MSRVGVVVQARMGSKRLPGKVLMPIGGKPLFQRVVERVDQMTGIDTVVLAHPVGPENEPLVELAHKLGLSTYGGSENNVLDRYYQAAKQFRLDPIIRITADCPLLDPDISSKVLRRYQSGGYDYYSNAYPVATFPDGLDTEVFSFATLERAHNEATCPHDKEHVTSYIWKHPQQFKLGQMTNPVDLAYHRWTVDTQEDLEYVREVYRQLESEAFRMQDILKRMLTPRTLTRCNAV